MEGNLIWDFFFLLLAPLAPGFCGSWWLLVASWLLGFLASGFLLSVAPSAPGSFGSWLLWLLRLLCPRWLLVAFWLLASCLAPPAPLASSAPMAPSAPVAFGFYGSYRLEVKNVIIARKYSGRKEGRQAGRKEASRSKQILLGSKKYFERKGKRREGKGREGKEGKEGMLATAGMQVHASSMKSDKWTRWSGGKGTK